MSAVVYRMYDPNCVLLYVGQSLNVTQRIASHASRANWFREVDTISVEHFDTKEQAVAAEREAIRTENPVFNIHHADPSKRPPVQYVEPRTTGLVANPVFVTEWMRIAEEQGQPIEFYETSAALRNSIMLGGKVDIEDAAAFCRDLRCSVASVFPNHGPHFEYVDDRGFVSTRKLAKEAAAA